MRWPDRRPGIVTDLATGAEQVMQGQKVQTMRLLVAKGANGLTQLEAFNEGGIARLASRVSELELKHGISLKDEWRETGEGVRFKAYLLGAAYAVREVA